jgi:hypothetical protein
MKSSNLPPEGQETITLPIKFLYNVLNNFNRSSKLSSEDNEISLEFVEQDTHQSIPPEEDRLIRIVHWNLDEKGNRVSINDVAEWQNLGCGVEENEKLEKQLRLKKLECDDLIQEYGILEDKQDRISDDIANKIRNGIDNIPPEYRWDFVKAFNPDLTIRQAEALANDPLSFHLKMF